tara:strand:- start:254 stop:679 length:426 start_codon:yes stop_codon:yes gene_type:complete
VDKYAKNRAKFKDKFKKVTKSDYDDLTPVQKRMFDAAKRLGLVVGAKPGTFTKKGSVTVFDPTTYERVPRKELNVGVFIKPKSKREPFKPSLGDKEYDTDIGQATPTTKPLLKSQLKKAGKDFMNGGAVMPNRGGKFKGVF